MYHDRVISSEIVEKIPIHFKPASVGLLEHWKIVLNKTENRDESTHYVLEYSDRLAIHKGDNLSWSDLVAIKNAIWGSDVMAVEVFPPDNEIIDLKPTRHLWRSNLVDLAVKEISNKLIQVHKDA